MVRRMAGLAASILVVLVLAGCAVPAGAGSAPSPSSSAPDVATTPTPAVVPAGTLPAGIADGDCARVTTPDEIASATGLVVSGYARAEGWSADLLRTLGGIACTFTTADGGGRVEVLPASEIGDPALAGADAAFYFENCPAVATWDVCSAEYRTDTVWVALTVYPAQTRSAMDAWGADLGRLIAADLSDAAEYLAESDTSRWWRDADCATLGADLAERTARTITGSDGGYSDGQTPGAAVAAENTGAKTCRVYDGESNAELELSIWPGTAWAASEVPDAEPLAVDVDGVDAWTTANGDVIVSDGVNAITVAAFSSDVAREIAPALAQIAASRV